MGKRKSPSNDKSASKKKGKRPPTAYSLFLKSTWENDEKKGNFSTFSKNCSALWAKMPDNDKQKYKDEAATQKEKWEEVKTEIKKPEPKKKRSPGPYIMFCSEMRVKVKNENPDFSMTKISKELGILWNKLTPEEKAKYQQKASEEKEKNTKEEEKLSSDDQNVIMVIEKKAENVVVEEKAENLVVDEKEKPKKKKGKIVKVAVKTAAAVSA